MKRPRRSFYRRAAARSTVLAASLMASGAGAEFQSSLTATVTLSDGAGAPLGQVAKGQPFRIEVALRDAATPSAPKGMALQGWLRRLGRSDSECRDAARAFRATRTLPQGAIDLNGVLLLQINRDGSLGVLDPKLDLRSSNMVAAAKFDAAPDAFAIDRRALVAYMVFRARGAVAAMSLLDGAVRPFADGLAHPSSVVVAPNGDVWIAEDGAVVRLNAAGERLGRETVGAGDVSMLASDDLLVAHARVGAVAAFDLASGAGRARFDAGAPIASAALATGGAFAALEAGGEALTIRFLDAPADAQRVPLRASAARLSASPSGRHVFATSSTHGGVSVVDVATARQVTGFEARRPIAEAVFTDRFGYFLVDDQTMAFALDLASVAIDKEPKLRPIPIPARSNGSVPTLGLLAAMRPSDNALAVSAETGAAYVLDEMPALGPAPPMNAVKLRGGVPLGIGVVDRSFRETAPGRFATYARLEKSGGYELVLTTGVAGMTVCAPIMVQGLPDARDDRLALTLRVAPGGKTIQPGRPQKLVLDFVDVEGHAYTIPTVELSIPSLSFNWAARVAASVGADGRLTADVTLPFPGSYAVQPIIPAAARATVSPGFIEVRE